MNDRARVEMGVRNPQDTRTNRGKKEGLSTAAEPSKLERHTGSGRQALAAP
jgi:hypothetical protein